MTLTGWQLTPLVMATLAGTGSGLLYFGGLWWTLRRIQRFRFPQLTLLLSFLGRLGAAGLVFLIIAKTGWLRLFFSLLGFMVMRQALLRRVSASSIDKRTVSRFGTQP